MAPAFSPDNADIVYSFVGPWDTWKVGVLGSDPRLLLPNSSSLSWIEGGKRLLFSEMRDGQHMVLVTTDEDEEIAAMFTSRRANAAWSIILIFRQMANRSSRSRWIVEASSLPAMWFPSRTQAVREWSALLTIDVFRRLVR